MFKQFHEESPNSHTNRNKLKMRAPEEYQKEMENFPIEKKIKKKLPLMKTLEWVKSGKRGNKQMSSRRESNYGQIKAERDEEFTQAFWSPHPHPHPHHVTWDKRLPHFRTWALPWAAQKQHVHWQSQLPPWHQVLM